MGDTMPRTDDPVARGICADWLEARGDPRAAYLRLRDLDLSKNSVSTGLIANRALKLAGLHKTRSMDSNIRRVINPTGEKITWRLTSVLAAFIKAVLLPGFGAKRIAQESSTGRTGMAEVRAELHRRVLNVIELTRHLLNRPLDHPRWCVEGGGDSQLNFLISEWQSLDYPVGRLPRANWFSPALRYTQHCCMVALMEAAHHAAIKYGDPVGVPGMGIHNPTDMTFMAGYYSSNHPHAAPWLSNYHVRRRVERLMEDVRVIDGMQQVPGYHRLLLRVPADLAQEAAISMRGYSMIYTPVVRILCDFRLFGRYLEEDDFYGQEASCATMAGAADGSGAGEAGRPAV